MRRLVLVLAFFEFALPALAAKDISVAELEQKLAASRGRLDVEVARQLSDFELTERLSTTALARLEANSPGTNTSQELKILADQSAFLRPPAAEIPPIAVPDLAAQRKMMALVVNYVNKTIHQLPNFYATRVTTHFEETPQIQTGTRPIPYRPLHETNAFNVTVLYRDGEEVVDTGKDKRKASKQQRTGLREWGVFGPILSTVFLDAARSNLSWSHWEQTPQGTQAVFQYAVPLEKSNYRVNYCCVLRNDTTVVEQWAPVDRIVGYHGEIAVDPHLGSILRLTVQADLRASDPISRADILVEYGPVEIGGKSYICATRSVALSTALSMSNFIVGDGGNVGSVGPSPHQKLLNDVAFEQYHMFRSNVRILAGDEGKEQGESLAAAPAAENPTENVKTLSGPQPAEHVEASSSTSGTNSALQTAPMGPSKPTAASPPTVTTDATPKMETTLAAIDQAPVFKTTTHEVVVDVVATEGDGKPVLNLGKQDFELRENGKPQTIEFFEAHTRASAVSSAPPEMPVMPLGARTNAPPAPPDDAVNVLLIDTLNTEMQDQTFVRRKVIDFLSKMQPGPRMAIFLLSSKLICLQGFTSDTSALLAAINDPRNGLKVQHNGLLQTRDDRASDAEAISELQAMGASGFAIEAIRSAMETVGNRQFSARAEVTYEALMSLGRSLSGVPGRKNLIWFAGSFPLVVFPTTDQLDREERDPGVPGHVNRVSMPMFMDRVKKTADLFTVAQIAVYPISAEGVMAEHIGLADSQTPINSAQGGRFGTQTETTMAPHIAEAGERANTIYAMEKLAASTGGKAYFNTNDLNGTLTRAIDDGANYYTIGYSPADKKMDGSYRQIEIKMTHGKTKLAYRQGYYADTSLNPAAQSNVDPLASLLQLGMPGATGILYGVRAEPASVQPTSEERRAGQNPELKGPITRYTVSFVIRGQDLILNADPQGGRSGQLLLGLKAYDHEGKVLNWEGEEETVNINPEQFDSIRKNGITALLSIDLPTTRDIHLVTAVYDRQSGMAGTLEVPLQVAPR